MSKARRTETLNAEFVDGYASGWCFGVHEAFRANLDISLDVRVDRAANEALAARLGRKPTAAESLTREVWTQGSPPSYSFDRGHLMHEPADVHRMDWADALPRLRRSILVIDAQADDGSTPPAPDTADAVENPEATEPSAARQAPAMRGDDAAQAELFDGGSDSATTATDADDGSNLAATPPHDGASAVAGAEQAAPASAGNGWVEFALYHHDNGQISRTETHRLSQADFVRLLKTGNLPGT